MPSLSEWDPKARMGKTIYPIMKRLRVITTFQYEDGRTEDVTWLDTSSFDGHMGVDKSVHVIQNRHYERVWKEGDLHPSEVRDRGLLETTIRVEYPSRVVEARKLSLDKKSEEARSTVVSEFKY